MTACENFLRRCILQRISKHEFEQLIALVKGKLNATSAEFCQAYFQVRDHFCVDGDTLFHHYLAVLLRSRSVVPSDLLVAAIHRWNSSKIITESDVALLHTLLEGAVAHHDSSLEERHLTLLLAARWLLVSTRSISSDLKQPHQLDLVEVLGTLVVSLASTNVLSSEPVPMRRLAKSATARLRQLVLQAVKSALSKFPPSSMQLYTRLDRLSKDLSAISDNEIAVTDAGKLEVLELEAGTVNNHIMPACIALVAYLDLIVGDVQ